MQTNTLEKASTNQVSSIRPDETLPANLSKIRETGIFLEPRHLCKSKQEMLISVSSEFLDIEINPIVNLGFKASNIEPYRSYRKPSSSLITAPDSIAEESEAENEPKDEIRDEIKYDSAEMIHVELRESRVLENSAKTSSVSQVKFKDLTQDQSSPVINQQLETKAESPEFVEPEIDRITTQQESIPVILSTVSASIGILEEGCFVNGIYQNPIFKEISTFNQSQTFKLQPLEAENSLKMEIW